LTLLFAVDGSAALRFAHCLPPRHYAATFSVCWLSTGAIFTGDDSTGVCTFRVLRVPLFFSFSCTTIAFLHSLLNVAGIAGCSAFCLFFPAFRRQHPRQQVDLRAFFSSLCGSATCYPATAGLRFGRLCRR